MALPVSLSTSWQKRGVLSQVVKPVSGLSGVIWTTVIWDNNKSTWSTFCCSVIGEKIPGMNGLSLSQGKTQNILMLCYCSNPGVLHQFSLRLPPFRVVLYLSPVPFPMLMLVFSEGKQGEMGLYLLI